MTRRCIGETKLTAGNIKQQHFYLRPFFKNFPDDLIGGSNKSLSASKTANIHWSGASVENTDIDGAKKIFRKRGFVGRFFIKNDAKAGDYVRVEEIAPYEYIVSLIK